ncbi:coiled-coil domain-containing protein, partial [Bacillus pumilus]|uniref:hypothetical protein n=1 Tax=Bacillus pumilus TaxID=1408 RepID=UPI001C92C94D
ETAIKQTEKEITLKADKTVVENIGNKVIDNEASIQVLSDGIKSKVEKKEFDNYTKRLNDAESLIEQTAESITSKVDKTEYDTLNETVVAQGTEITQLKDEIVLKVEKEDFNELSGRVNEAETSITLNQDAIALKAEKTELDNVSGKVNNIESELVITNEAINQRVTKTEFEKLEDETDKLGTRISNAESTLEQTEKEIALRVTRKEFEEETSTAIKESEAQIKITTDGILQSVSELNSTVSDHGMVITENSSSIETLNNQIKSKVTQTEIDDSIKKINLGGENLLQNSNLAYFDENGVPAKWSIFDSSFEVDGSTLLDGNNTIHFKYASGTYPIASSNYIDVTSHIGEEVVFSVYALIPLDKELSNVPYIEIASYSDNSISNQGGSNPQFASLRLPTKGNGKWVRYECKGKIPEKNAYGNVVKIKANLRFNGSTNPSSNDEFWYGLPQLEYGSIKQDWRPSSIDLTNDITELSVRIKEAEQVITPDAIIGTVTSSESFANLMDEKANADLLGEYATNDQLSDALEDVNSSVDKKISEIDFTPFVQSSTFKQTTSDITAKFTSAGGVNLIKNSVGFAGFDFWTGSNLNGIGTISNDGELEALGYGSGFLFTPSTTANSLVQVINVIPNQEYTLSWSINKNNATPSGSMDGAFAVQFMDETASTSLKTYWYQSPDITDGYQNYRTDSSDEIDEPLKHVMTYKPTTNKIAIRLYAYKLADVAITGLLLNVGSQPLQWSMAQGEIYNTSMKMDMKGLKVSKIDDNKVSRFTVMTPEKFAGYYDVNKDGFIDDSTGSPDEVFRMDEDYFVMKNAILSGEEAEFKMGALTMKRIDSGGNNGWAFVPSTE